MRVIFEEVDQEFFFEVILNPIDFEKIESLGGIIGNFVWEGSVLKDLNVYIRKEKENELCQSLKEKKPVLPKVSLKTSKEKCMKAKNKTKASPSLIAKRAKAKKLLPRKKPAKRK